MKKVYLEIDYQGKTYKGSVAEVSDAEFIKEKEFIKNISNGEVSNLVLVDGNITASFSKQVLMNSVIKLIEIK